MTEKTAGRKAIAEIEELLAQTDSLLASGEASESEDHPQWRIRVAALLDRVFGESSRYAREFAAIPWSGPRTYLGMGAGELAFPDEMRRARAVLRAARDEIARDPSGRVDVGTSGVPAADDPEGKRVFVVHGHNDRAKNDVAQLLSRVGLDAVVLHERPDQGRTIIEKFEECSDVSYAVVICTGDDEGRSRRDEGELRPRPRQNVVLELGFFVGRLGRRRVSVLYEEGVELPSDYDGVLYIKMIASENWKLKLVRELKSAGIAVDLEAALEAL